VTAGSATWQGRVIPATLVPADIAAMIDHALLTPDLVAAEVRAGCELAGRRAVFSVCVKPADVILATEVLAGTGVRVGTVIGFPHGSSASSVKRYEAEIALEDGAVELDMVVNIAALRDRDDAYVVTDIGGVVGAARESGALVKVILENAYLDDEQIARGSRLAEEAGADFVKTSTGFAASGATVHDLLIMAAATSPAVGLKAAGGIRNVDRVLELVAIGVTRLGASATAAILDEAEARVAESGPLVVSAPPLGGDSGPPDGY
jgi:deoxyribose-phosphate aldolase